MNLGRWRMSEFSCAEQATLARRLVRLGCPSAFAEEGGGLAIYQIGNVLQNSILDLEGGGAAYILDLVIVNDLLETIRIAAFELEIPALDDQIRWLEPQGKWYRFPGSSWEPFERVDILNHRIDRKGTLRPGGTAEGLILGVGRPLPVNFRTGMSVAANFLVVDHRGMTFSQRVSLRVNRKMRPHQTLRIPSRGRLFEPVAGQIGSHPLIEQMGAPEISAKARDLPRNLRPSETSPRGATRVP